MADLLCEWCRVNYKRDRRAARSYGMWGLCGDCYAELGQPKLGSGRPTIGRDGKVNFGRFPAAAEAPSPAATATLPELPKLNPTREQRSEKMENKRVRQMRTDIDAAEVQADRNNGMKLKELGKKYDVSDGWICTHTHPAPNRNGNMASAESRTTTTRRAKIVVPKANRLNRDEILADLRAKRDAYEQAIDALTRAYSFEQ